MWCYFARLALLCTRFSSCICGHHLQTKVFFLNQIITPVQMLNSKIVDQKLNWWKICNVFKWNIFWLHVYIFYLSPFFILALCSMLGGCEIIFWLTCFYCWCRILNYCGQNLFNKLKRENTLQSVCCNYINSFKQLCHKFLVQIYIWMEEN